MFKVNIHEFKTNKSLNIKIAFLADIHYFEEFSLEEKIIDNIKNNKPNYICISGDIIDTYPFLDKEENIYALKKFIEKLSYISKVFMIFGSHDLEDVKNPIDDFTGSIKKWKSIFKNNKKVYILDNENYTDDLVNIIGINLPSNYYNGYPSESSIIVNNLFKNNIKANKNKYNILMIHSPRRVFENIDYLKNIDLVLCGHMHDGCIPKFFKWLPGTRGVIGPHKSFFPKYSRGVISKDNLKMIVTGGVIKVAPSHLKRRNIVDMFYNNEMEIINIRGIYD